MKTLTNLIDVFLNLSMHMLLYSVESSHVNEHRAMVAALAADVTQGAGQQECVNAFHKRRRHFQLAVMERYVTISVFLGHPSVETVFACVIAYETHQRQSALPALGGRSAEDLHRAD